MSRKRGSAVATSAPPKKTSRRKVVKERSVASVRSTAPSPAPPSWQQLGAAAGVYAVITLVLAYPALTGGFLVSGTSDQYLGGYAVRTFGGALWRATGHIPQWNPYIFGGMPFIGSMNGDIFYPPAVLMRYVLRPDVALTWLFIVHEFLAGLFAYVFFRGLGLRFTGALVAGLAYMLGGPIASYVSPGHDGKLYVSALFPLMGWAVIRGMRDGRRWAWPVLAVITGFAVLTPHPQLLQYALIGTGAIGLYLAFWSPEAKALSRRVAIRRLGFALLAVGLGLAMGAIQFAPVLEYVKYSPRAGGGMAGAGGYAWSTSFSMPPEELFGTYLPEFFGILSNYWGRTGIHFQSDYLGAAVLVLAGAAFFSKRKRERWFWIAFAGVSLVWTLGGYTPFYHVVYALVPGTKYFRAPATIFFLTAFAVAGLAGRGAEAVLDGDVKPAYVFSWIAVAAGFALLAIGGALATVAGALAVPELYDRVLASAPQVSVGALRALLAVCAVAIVVLLTRRGRMPVVAAGWLLVFVIATDLWSEERLYWKWSPPASITFASNPAIDSLRAQREPGRVLTVAAGRGTPGDADLLYDGLMVHGIRQVVGHHSNELYRYDELIDKPEMSKRAYQRNVWAFLNVRFVYTDLDSLPLPGAQKIVGPVPDAAGSMVSLYRLPGDNPAAWVVPLAVKMPDEQALGTIIDPRFLPQSAAIFDTAANVPVTANPTSLPPASSVVANVTRYDPGHIIVALNAPAPAGSTLIVSENDYPGWSAKVDGRPATVARADYTLMGVPLTLGARVIDLTYTDPIAHTGVAITLAALVAALGWWGVVLIRRLTPLRRPASIESAETVTAERRASP